MTAFLKRHNGHGRRGLSLFELAVVVAIGVVVFAVMLYSSRGLITQTKVSRVQEEHRAITRALQNYALDYSALPGAKQGLASLSRPTAYLGSVPEDPFQDHGTYLYLSPPSGELVSLVISPGPDGDFDLPQELWRFTNVGSVDRERVPVTVLRSELEELTVSAAAMAEHDPEDTLRQPMSEAEAAILSTYLQLGSYDPAKGEDGDIITVVRF